ncbi:hypothetical protein AB0395_29545 [Streptosporangium sp. NPDC051023]|uniref:hypothetical protein n=1 Tax=Streptosporangium sp. NPDC051023 TaxID=3155410 RepID=UPI00344C8BAA
MIRDESVRRVGRLLGMTVVLLSAHLLISGCGVFYGKTQVAPAVLDEVRGIGKVLGEATDEGDYGAGIEVTNLLVIDVGGVNGHDASSKAGDLLRDRKWVVVRQVAPDGVEMRSTVWKGVYLDFQPFYPEERRTYPDEINKAIKASARPETLLIVSLDQT